MCEYLCVLMCVSVCAPARACVCVCVSYYHSDTLHLTEVHPLNNNITMHNNPRWEISFIMEHSEITDQRLNPSEVEMAAPLGETSDNRYCFNRYILLINAFSANSVMLYVLSAYPIYL